MTKHLDPPLAAVPRDGVADWGRCDRRDERRLPGKDGEYRGHVRHGRFIVDMVDILEVVYMELMVDIRRVPSLTCLQVDMGHMTDMLDWVSMVEAAVMANTTILLLL